MNKTKACAGLVVTWQGSGSGAYGSHRRVRSCEAHESQMATDDPWAHQVYEGGRDDVTCDYARAVEHDAACAGCPDCA